jgi:DNA-binding NarL/FixJ family response regulator
VNNVGLNRQGLHIARASAQQDPQVTAAALRLLAAWLAELAHGLARNQRRLPPAPSVRALDPATRCPTDVRLTPRELQVVACIARGLTNRQIAAELVIATSTTERHVANVLGKLGMQSRAHVAAWAAERGIGVEAA